MKSLWKQEEADLYKENICAMRAYTSRLLGANEDLVLHGGGNTSAKGKLKNIFGEEEDILFVKGSGHDLKTIQENGFSPTKLNTLKRLAALPSLSDSEMMRELKLALVDPSAPTPSVEAILHAIIPFRFVDHSHADAVVAISNTPHGEEKIKEIYGNDVLVLPYIMPGFILSKQVHEATLDLDWNQYKAIILLHHGVFTFSDDPKTSYENMIDICNTAEEYLKEKSVWDQLASKEAQELCPVKISTFRKDLSHKAGQPMLVHYKSDNLSVGYSTLDNIDQCACQGPITPDHVLQTKRIPIILENDFKEALNQYCHDYQEYFKRNASGDLTCLDPAPRFAVIPGCGLLAMAPTVKRMRIVSDLIDHTIKAVQWGEHLGGWRALSEKEIFDLEYWELEQAKLKRTQQKPQFEGRVVVVTGGASGIGKACVESFLQQGAAVASLDISSSITSSFNHSAYLGIQCDATDTEAVKEALKIAIQKFGGIDMVISNAGNFPKSSLISETDDTKWEQSLKLNLDSHFKLLRESTPYLRNGIDPVFIFMGSKNVGAPGPGVASYSVAKAGLTQLARTAALEMGEYGIRVMTFHPNQVFDTGIWDDETLALRAKNYNLSVEEYKKNNVLKTNITSKDVAAIVAQMSTNIFSKMTGVQVPIDGGNERII